MTRLDTLHWAIKDADERISAVRERIEHGETYDVERDRMVELLSRLVDAQWERTYRRAMLVIEHKGVSKWPVLDLKPDS